MISIRIIGYYFKKLICNYCCKINVTNKNKFVNNNWKKKPYKDQNVKLST